MGQPALMVYGIKPGLISGLLNLSSKVEDLERQGLDALVNSVCNKFWFHRRGSDQRPISRALPHYFGFKVEGIKFMIKSRRWWWWWWWL
jgi:hypothetical protein